MQSTYSDALSTKAEERLKSQYGLGAKRYGAVASWKTIFKVLYFDLKGNSIAESLYKANHPAQLHYGFWDRSTKSFDDAIINATLSAFSKLSYGANFPKKIVHFGSGFGGVEKTICEKYPKLQIHGITIDDLQAEVSRNLAELSGLSNRVTYFNGNFLNVDSFKGNIYEGGMGIESLCHIPEKQLNKLWKTIGAILTPNAKFVVHDWYRRPNLSNLESKELEIFLRGWDMPSCPLINNMISAARDNGFLLVEDNDVTPDILKSANKIYERALIFKQFVLLFRKTKIKRIQELGIGHPQLMDFVNTCLIQKKLFKNKTISYHQMVFLKK